MKFHYWESVNCLPLKIEYIFNLVSSAVARSGRGSSRDKSACFFCSVFCYFDYSLTESLQKNKYSVAGQTGNT